MANALFTSLVNAVYTETNRPDLVADTMQAVLSATTQAHCLDYFPRDLNAAQVVFDSSAYIQELDTTTIPFYRSISYIRKNDPTYSAYQQNPTILPPMSNNNGLMVWPAKLLRSIEIIEPDEYLDPYWNSERVDVAYQAGSQINIKSSTSFQYALIGWYTFPKLDPNLYDSWIAQNFPEAIFVKASAIIFANTGDDESLAAITNPNTGRIMNAGKTGIWDLLKQNNISAKGR